MKLLSLLPLLLCFSAANLCAQRALQKNPATGALIEGFKSGAFTIEIDAAGTLKWNSGSTLTNADHFRTSAGLVIGTNVQAYDADLTTYAGITPSANVQSLLGAADFAAVRTALGLGTVATLNVSAAGNATNNAIPQLDATGRFITHNALGVADPGNLTRTGELAVDGVIFSDVSGSGFFQFITLATPTANRTHTLPDASGTLINTGNLSAITAVGTLTSGEVPTTLLTGTITNAQLAGSIDLTTKVTGALPVANGGTGQTTVQAAINALLAASGALSQGDVFYFNGTNVVRLAPGTSGHYLQTQGAAANPQWAAVSTGVALGDANTWTAAQTISLSALGTTPTSGLVLVNPTAATSGNQQYSPSTLWQGNGYDSGGAASQTVAFRAYSLPVQGGAGATGKWVLQSNLNSAGWTDRLTLSTDGSFLHNGTTFGSAAGQNMYLTAGGSFLILGYSGTWKVALDSDTLYPWTDKAVGLGNSSHAFKEMWLGGVLWASGAGTPEGAVTAPVGSLYTRTDGGASTTLYVKESGTGNTGWIAK